MEIDFIPYTYEFSEFEKKEILYYLDKNLLTFLNENNLNKKIEFIGSIQYLDLVKEINDFFNKNKDFIVSSTKFAFAKENSQILGCSYQTKLKEDVTYIVVGDGIFHPGALIYNNQVKKEIVLFDIFKKEFNVVDFLKEYNKYLIMIDKMKTLFSKSRNIGIFVSTKPGQSYIENAKTLKKRLENIGKNVYLFISNNIDSNEFMNFNYIDFIINTACPRIFTDDFERYEKIINYFEFVNEILKDY
ncbi:MAG: diphthamide synthesis protein [Candidatus Nanoarchaeia archaeon]|nr:diphthamide synthesis protein [Candidatus Nanoarchaeia archaeon]